MECYSNIQNRYQLCWRKLIGGIREEGEISGIGPKMKNGRGKLEKKIGISNREWNYLFSIKIWLFNTNV